MDWLARHPATLICSLIAACITIWSAIHNSPFWIALSIIAFLLVVANGICSHKRHGAGQESNAQSSPATAANAFREPTKREERRMTCRYCDGTGQITAYQDVYRKQTAVCGICNGHGDYVTDLWAQPDCKYCKGTAKVVTERTMYNTRIDICGICGGTGKRPFDT